MKIAIVGTGYVGLVTGACLASWGHQVVCVDHDQAKIDGLLVGVMPIFEPGLATLVADGVATGCLSFSSRLAPSVFGAQVVLVAVGTPSAEDGDADLSYLYAASRAVAEHLEDGAVVAIKSTVPVGTGDVVERIIRSSRPGLSFAVCSNPEFLREGSAIRDFLEPDRVVVGSDDARARSVMLELYEPVANAAPIVLMGRRTSELTKYAANSFLATKVTFINEMADLCEQVGANVSDLAYGMGLDARIGGSFLKPGPGYGGSCFPKDTLALVRTAQRAGVSLRIVEDSVAANDARKRSMALRVIGAAGGDVDGQTIAILGLSFKANTDDMRDAPALPLIRMLQDLGANIKAYDPIANSKAAEVLENVEFSDDAYSCASGAKVAVIVTDWDEFKKLDLERLSAAMNGDVLVDLRNIVRAEDATISGLKLVNIGRGSARAEGALLPKSTARDGKHEQSNMGAWK